MAARYHSVLRSSTAMKFEYNSQGDSISILKYDNITLSQLGMLVSTFLSNANNAVSVPNYFPRANPEDAPAYEAFYRSYKRKFSTDIFITLAW